MRKLIFPAILFLAASPAFALPGELAAVTQHCGEPHAENYTTSQVTSSRLLPAVSRWCHQWCEPCLAA